MEKITLMVWLHDVIFHSNFIQLPQVSRLESMVLQSIYNLFKPIQYYHCMGKSHCDITILTRESMENRTHFRFSVDLRLCFRLFSGHTVRF